MSVRGSVRVGAVVVSRENQLELAMERFVADYHMAAMHLTAVEKNGIKAAVIGCGPSGITCAGEFEEEAMK